MEEKELIKLSFDDIIRWIMQHSDDEVVMDKINRLTFTFTAKYKEFSNK